MMLAQRLARRLCKRCKEPAVIPEGELLKLGVSKEDIPNFKPFKAVGCSMCTDGYKGRTGIFQVLPITEEVKALIMSGCTQIDIEKLAAQMGVADLRQAGLIKVKEGLTSLDEVERVTNR